VENERIEIRGAAEHNLAGVDLTIPKKKLVVFTGVSGSGKSSLAFDTLFAEGNRRYVESLSTYARQFLGQMQKPRYEMIRGLAPAISIQQKTLTQNPRSTVGTITEIYDYLRLLFARVGDQHCSRCEGRVQSQSVGEMVADILKLPPGTKFQVLAPFTPPGGGGIGEAVYHARKRGFVRIRVGGKVHSIDTDPPDLGDGEGEIEVVVDRLIMKDPIFDRLSDSVELAAKTGRGMVTVLADTGEERAYSERPVCRRCRIDFPPLSPQSFSFNAPQGMCPRCQGLGRVREIDPECIVPDTSLSLRQGAIKIFKTQEKNQPKRYYQKELEKYARKHRIPLDKPWKALREEHRDLLLHGERDPDIWFEGAAVLIQRRLAQTRSAAMVRYYTRFFRESVCPDCQGRRLRPESLSVRVGGRNVSELTVLSVDEARAFFRDLAFTGERQAVASEIRKEIEDRLGFLSDVGVGYLTLDRSGGSLSGGESQRIHLASQLGADLTGVMYILDEPSIGLHPRDAGRLVETLKSLRDGGNTVIVVEHDPGIIRQADHVVDFGPGAGILGGRIVFSGAPEDLLSDGDSLTGAYLAGRKVIGLPERRRRPGKKALRITGASENNLRDISVSFPLGLLICVTGVSGAGKSSLVNQVLYPAIRNRMLRRSPLREGAYRRISGLAHITRIVSVDQKPIGKTPRSNPVIYTGAFNHIRDLFAALRESRVYGYDKSRFSFNLKGGRCEACQGDGLKRIEMHFLPDVYVPCDVCGGSRYNLATLKVRYKGYSIADVLNLTVAEALDLFGSHPAVLRPLSCLAEVGLDYIKLGQSSPTLSGGEAQRVKLARELSKTGGGDTLYLLDEPTTGLHFDDIRKLLAVLDRLVEEGNTVVVIEHNLEVIKSADHVIDLGPGGGGEGGEVVATGPPEKIAACGESLTGGFLRDVL
jgi:excinuclease ABC subunit A